MKKKKYWVFLLQEVHSSAEIEKMWYAEWGYQSLYSHGENDAPGVAILFKNDFAFQIHEVIRDTEGRYIIVDVTINNKRIILGNVYGPNEDKPEFYEEFIEKIESLPNLAICR